MAQENTYTHKGIPHTYLIGPNSEVLWDGHPVKLTNNLIEKFLAKRVEAVAERFAGAPRSAITQYLSGRLPESYATLTQALKNEKKEEKKEPIQRMLSFVESQIQDQLSYADQLTEKKEYLEAYNLYAAAKQNWKNTDFGKKAAEKLKKFSDKEIQAELEASQLLQKILSSALKKSSKNNTEAIQLLQELANSNRYRDTKAAEKASSLADMLSK